MKKYIAILILILSCQAGYSQSMDKLFNDFANQKNVTRVTIGPFLMKISSLFTETMGVKSIEVLSFEECGSTVKNDLRTAIKKLKDPNYETMVNSNEGGSRTKVMVRIDKDIIRELVILTTDGGDDALIRIKGKIKPSDIEKVKMDVESFKRLFLPLHPKLFRIAYALVENKSDAEDILQDAYYKLWSRRNELADVRKPEAFCVTLVKNLCLDFLRSPRAGRHDEDVTEAVTLSTDSSPDKELEMQDKVEQVRHLINRLPENQRQVLRLRGIEDCSIDEIEQITGLSAVNIRVLLSRARKIIREQFEKYYAYEYER